MEPGGWWEGDEERESGAAQVLQQDEHLQRTEPEESALLNGLNRTLQLNSLMEPADRATYPPCCCRRRVPKPFAPPEPWGCAVVAPLPAPMGRGHPTRWAEAAQKLALSCVRKVCTTGALAGARPS